MSLKNKVKVDIICPLYNAEKYILNLHKSLLKQKKIEINEIKYIFTESIDNTEKLLIENKINYEKITKEEFSHSTARENAAKQSDADIVVFITQDVVIENEDWLEKLIKPIIEKEADACYSRQLTKYNNIEKYIRECNYPDKSILKTKDNIDEMGLKTFFFSDASSAINRKVFEKLNYYDGKRFMFNEDMYIAHKLIVNGYKIKYCADSIVYHSHEFTLRQLYQRYYDSGVFFKQNEYLDNYGTNKAGGGLAKHILKRALQDKNIKVLLEFFPNMIIRFIGLKMGKIRG